MLLTAAVTSWQPHTERKRCSGVRSGSSSEHCGRYMRGHRRPAQPPTANWQPLVDSYLSSYAGGVSRSDVDYAEAWAANASQFTAAGSWRARVVNGSLWVRPIHFYEHWKERASVLRILLLAAQQARAWRALTLTPTLTLTHPNPDPDPDPNPAPDPDPDRRAPSASLSQTPSSSLRRPTRTRPSCTRAAAATRPTRAPRCMADGAPARRPTARGCQSLCTLGRAPSARRPRSGRSPHISPRISPHLAARSLDAEDLPISPPVSPRTWQHGV